MRALPALTGSEKYLLTQLHQTSRLLLACLVLQLPFGFWRVSQGESFALLNLLFHSAIIMLGLRLSANNRLYPARTLLLTGFMSFITLATLVWQKQPGIPYFLLLGAVTCGFFFRRKEARAQRTWAVAFGVMFVLLSFQAPMPHTHLGQAVYVSNTITLACASLLILYTLEMSSKHRWINMLASQRQLQERLQQLLPPVFSSLPQSAPTGQTYPIDICAVLFADMAGFKRLTTQLDDEDIVCVLNALYQRFDQRAQRLGICRIKTNGDEYMAALSNTFDSREDRRTCVADEMLCFASQISHDFHQVATEFAVDIDLRIGISLGPVRAGIIGSQRPAFDIWGRTVNLASVLEQLSQPGSITVCPQFYYALSSKTTVDFKACAVPLPDGPGFAMQLSSTTELKP